MFELTGYFGERYDSTGKVTRQERYFKTSLSSEDSVVTFIRRHEPFVKLRIMEQDCKFHRVIDKTEYFIKPR